MSNRFVSFLEHVGHAFKRGLDVGIPIAELAAGTVIPMFVPALGPLFNATVSAVVTAEQSAIAAGTMKAGPQKAAAVIALVGPLVKQTYADLGMPNGDAEIQRYVDSIVLILKSLPAPSQMPQPVYPPILVPHIPGAVSIPPIAE